eukprot:Rhum_TRINITY_DN15981_c0_g1::Rhum_TRINITY_DN15981_c0_g1_i1::g.162574::m.162574
MSSGEKRKPPTETLSWHMTTLPAGVAEEVKLPKDLVDTDKKVYSYQVVEKVNTKGKLNGERNLYLTDGLLIMQDKKGRGLSRYVHVGAIEKIGWAVSGSRKRLTIFQEHNGSGGDRPPFPDWVFELLDDHPTNRQLPQWQFLCAISNLRSLYKDDPLPLVQYESAAKMWSVTRHEAGSKAEGKDMKAAATYTKRVRTQHATATPAAKRAQIMQTPGFSELVSFSTGRGAQRMKSMSQFLKPTKVVVRRGNANDMLGINFAQCVIVHVVETSPAGRCGCLDFLGWTCTQVNNTPVATLPEMMQALKGETTLSLRLIPPDSKYVANAQRRSGGAHASDTLEQPTLFPNVESEQTLDSAFGQIVSRPLSEKLNDDPWTDEELCKVPLTLNFKMLGEAMNRQS